jgi:hypothetical protein
MGLLQSTCYGDKNCAVVLQTGKIRGKHINEGVKYLDDMRSFPNGIIHRLLPSEIESKYEAMDFIQKFNLGNVDFINIYNSSDNLLEIRSDKCDTQDPNLLLDNVNIIVACGSTSLQAFKITMDGGKVLLPISYLNKDDDSIQGNKDDPNLNVESLNNFGGSSLNQDIAVSVLNFLKANAFSSASKKTNVVFVNQLGYSVLGFNPRDGKPLIPKHMEKVVSLKYPIMKDGFKINNGKTALVELISKLITGEIKDERLELSTEAYENMMYLVARQCKVYINGISEELSGQWAKLVLNMIKNEPYLELDNLKNIGFVMDLGGSSGTLYSVSNKDTCVKVDRKTFMKEKSPNSYINDLDGFFSQFSQEYSELFK